MPAVSLKGEGDAPGNTDQVFALERGMSRVRTPVGIAENEPEDTVRPQDAAYFTEDLKQRSHVFLGRRFESELTLAAAVITLLKIRWAGDDALDAFGAQWNLSRITLNDHSLSSAFRARLTKRGAFFPPLGGGAVPSRKTPASDFVTCRNAWVRHGAKMCAAISAVERGGAVVGGAGRTTG